MVCVYCGSETKVTNSRHQKRTNQVWRRRQCLKCTALFTTEEKTDHTSLWKVKKNNEETLVAFSRDKLFLSIYKSCEHRLNALADAASLTETVISKLIGKTPGIIDSLLIQQTTQIALNRFDKAASVYYQAYHPTN